MRHRPPLSAFHRFEAEFRKWILLHPNESSAILARYVSDTEMANVINLSEYFYRQNINVPRASYDHDIPKRE
jgi:hypothetical protein